MPVVMLPDECDRGDRLWPRCVPAPPTVSRAKEAITEVVRNLGVLAVAAEQARPALQELSSWDRVARLHLNEYELLLAEGVSGGF